MTEKTGLVRALIQKGWIDEKTVEQAQAKADGGPNGLLLALIKSDALDERKVAQFAAETFGLPVLDIAAVNPDVLPRKLIDAQIASRYQIVALSQRKGKTVIAVADPTQVRVYDEPAPRGFPKLRIGGGYAYTCAVFMPLHTVRCFC